MLGAPGGVARCPAHSGWCCMGMAGVMGRMAPHAMRRWHVTHHAARRGHAVLRILHVRWCSWAGAAG